MSEQKERSAFEAWYAEDANTSTGRPGWMTPEDIAKLRDGEGYGADRAALNGKWEGWQARAALAAAPLTDAEIDKICRATECPANSLRTLGDKQWLDLFRIAFRAAERAHGIGTAAAPAHAPQWQPAEIAPTETGLYLVRIGAQTHVAQFNLRTSTAQWWNAYGSPSRLAQQPTHWMPLPAAPDAARAQAQKGE